MALYKKISDCDSLSFLNDIEKNILKTYGPIPVGCAVLLESKRLSLSLRGSLVYRLEIKGGFVSLFINRKLSFVNKKQKNKILKELSFYSNSFSFVAFDEKSSKIQFKKTGKNDYILIMSIKEILDDY